MRAELLSSGLSALALDAVSFDSRTSRAGYQRVSEDRHPNGQIRACGDLGLPRAVFAEQNTPITLYFSNGLF